ncbi:MAG: threonine ammonia-lyase, partial [Planctomycetota bacterium]
KVRAQEPLAAVISGGNIDLTVLGRLIESGLSNRGNLHRIHLRVDDEPGTLRRVLAAVEGVRGNILDVRHDRAGWKVPVGAVDLDLLVELRSGDLGVRIERALTAEGFRILELVPERRGAGAGKRASGGTAS